MSASYFLYDWIFCTLFSGTGVLENMHHLATVVGLLAGISCVPSRLIFAPSPLADPHMLQQIQPQWRRALRLPSHGRAVQPIYARTLHLPQPGSRRAASVPHFVRHCFQYSYHNLALTMLCRYNEVLFAVSYFIGRIVFGTWLV